MSELLELLEAAGTPSELIDACFDAESPKQAAISLLRRADADGEAAVAAWLDARRREKDELLGEFVARGEFPAARCGASHALVPPARLGALAASVAIAAGALVLALTLKEVLSQ